ncbi:MAG: diacylglycerol/lipid kinase family protein [Candidatus Sumerlaeaceae bacterium]
MGLQPQMKAGAIVLLVNPNAGSAGKIGSNEELLSSVNSIAGIHVHLISPKDDLTQLVRQWIASGTSAIGVAGGDGTISSVAHLLVGTDTALVPIPYGTLNHFCKDVGTPLDPVIAARALDSSIAQEILIDVGSVNGRHFINNSSLGLYPYLVRRREKRQHVLGKWMAYLVAAFEFLRHPVRIKVQLSQEEGGQPFHAGLVFVSNNAVEKGFWSAGQRPRLDAGQLQLFVVKEGTVWATLRAAVAFLRGRSEDCPVLSEHRLQQLVVFVKHRTYVRVSCDGETIKLQLPIVYRIVPKALRVRILRTEDQATLQAPTSSS